VPQLGDRSRRRSDSGAVGVSGAVVGLTGAGVGATAAGGAGVA
jgi:hypothetical protein